MDNDVTPDEAEKQRRFLKAEAELQRDHERQQARDEQEFERAKASFHENSEHLRDLNKLMWQVPLVAMTLTGGLWERI